MWRKFSEDVRRQSSDAAFYAEKAPVWLAPMLRQYLDVITIYNFRDSHDIFLSSNAFMTTALAWDLPSGGPQPDGDCALVQVRGPDFHMYLPVWTL